ncbi:tyrosine-protein phosphatase [uncultured Rummeliibacillus sp.]|uniref:tyrosine-protein phosphatase n=1 Tax=uncultured Rummeliibacillus sp. TaxID=762292 RepID=UPI00261E9692|nr:tyrosine-protein phosphatase [uncultured Rummeliibacillus sp.]
MANKDKSYNLSFEKVMNFRDMGGYETSDGRRVKKGIFYRSGDLSRMTDKDKALLESLGIRTIFDYRDDDEAIAKPDPTFKDVANIRIPAKRNDGIKMPSVTLKDIDNKKFLERINADIFTEMYSQLAFNNPSYQKLIEIIQEPDRLGILHHCAAGKDRTGVGGALILLALGVPRNLILADYLLTNDYMKPMRDAMIPILTKHLNETEMRRFGDIMSAKERYLEAVFQAIDQKYGDENRFFEEEYGLDFPKRQKLQHYYLE